MRLIDADALNDYVMDIWGGGNTDNTCIWYGNVLEVINDAPTVDAKPVVHGRWINEDVDWVCSVCGADAMTEGDYRQIRSPYCPNCGAKMDLEGE